MTPRINSMMQKQQMQDLSAEIQHCRRCELKHSVRHVVVGRGSYCPKLLFVGEAPGANEDATGRPFVGQSGRLLENILKESNLREEDYAIVNVLKCRPPNNRGPTQEEIDKCRCWLVRQINILQPKLICCLGVTACKWFEWNGHMKGAAGTSIHTWGYNIPVMAAYHPAAALHRPKLMGAMRASIKKSITMMNNMLEI